MARSLHVPGEAMVAVRGASDSSISARINLGLAASELKITPVFKKLDVNVNAWGDAPVDVQHMLDEVRISMDLVHFDRDVLDELIRLSMGGGSAVIGEVNRAGTLLGNNTARFAAGNRYVSMYISSPVSNKPWRFFYAYLADNPVDFPVGVQRSIVNCNFRAIPYTNDPWGGGTAQPNTVAGTGALRAVIWDHNIATD